MKMDVEKVEDDVDLRLVRAMASAVKSVEEDEVNIDFQHASMPSKVIQPKSLAPEVLPASFSLSSAADDSFGIAYQPRKLLYKVDLPPVEESTLRVGGSAVEEDEFDFDEGNAVNEAASIEEVLRKAKEKSLLPIVNDAEGAEYKEISSSETARPASSSLPTAVDVKVKKKLDIAPLLPTLPKETLEEVDEEALEAEEQQLLQLEQAKVQELRQIEAQWDQIESQKEYIRQEEPKETSSSFEAISYNEALSYLRLTDCTLIPFLA